jgi:hypothetical protein
MRKSIGQALTAERANKYNKKTCWTSSDIGAEQENHNVGGSERVKFLCVLLVDMGLWYWTSCIQTEGKLHQQNPKKLLRHRLAVVYIQIFCCNLIGPGTVSCIKVFWSWHFQQSYQLLGQWHELLTNTLCSIINIWCVACSTFAHTLCLRDWQTEVGTIASVHWTRIIPSLHLWVIYSQGCHSGCNSPHLRHIYLQIWSPYSRYINEYTLLYTAFSSKYKDSITCYIPQWILHENVQ